MSDFIDQLTIDNIRKLADFVKAKNSGLPESVRSVNQMVTDGRIVIHDRIDAIASRLESLKYPTHVSWTVE